MDASELNPDFKDFLRLLTEHEVKYLLIGGYAVAYHGYPRPTYDLDLWVQPVEENAERVVQALTEFGFGTAELSPELFLPSRNLIRLGRAPYLIEISTQIDGVNFDECYRRRERTSLGGISVSLLSLADLRANKRASGRLKDLADLENLPEA